MREASARPPRPKVLLVGLTNGNVTAETSRLFRAAGCAVEALCPADSWLLRGRQPDRWHPAPKTPDGFAAAAANAARGDTFAWVVPVDDDALRALADHLEGDLAATILPVQDRSFFEVVGGKAALSQRCAASGVPTPPFAIYENDRQMLRAAEQVGFPLLLKVDRSGGGRGITRCCRVEEVERALAKMSPAEKIRLLAQRYVPGAIVCVEALYREGRLIAAACSQVIHNVDGEEFGASATREYSRNAPLEKIVETLGATIGAHGFASMTFMRDRTTGEHLAIEADLRPQAWFRISREAGVDFSSGIRSFLDDARRLPPQRESTVILRHWPRDILRCLRGKKDWRGLAAWAIGAGGRWRTLPWDDHRLFASWLSEIIRSLLYRFPSARPAMRAVSRMLRPGRRQAL